MNYNGINESIINEFGDSNSAIVNCLFEQAVELAQNEKLEEAIEICQDALIFCKYSNIGYEIIYLLGLLSEIYLNNNQLEIAENIFNLGMTLIKRGKEKNMDEGSYDKDIDSFLDLKIKIDKAFKL